eukprot:scaffold12837_cov121-Isochrysis_galbana.AAC.4
MSTRAVTSEWGSRSTASISVALPTSDSSGCRISAWVRAPTLTRKADGLCIRSCIVAPSSCVRRPSEVQPVGSMVRKSSCAPTSKGCGVVMGEDGCPCPPVCRNRLRKEKRSCATGERDGSQGE